MSTAEADQLFERLWHGDAAMEEWAATVAGGSARPISDDAIAILEDVDVSNYHEYK